VLLPRHNSLSTVLDHDALRHCITCEESSYQCALAHVSCRTWRRCLWRKSHGSWVTSWIWVSSFLRNRPSTVIPNVAPSHMRFVIAHRTTTTATYCQSAVFVAGMFLRATYLLGVKLPCSGAVSTCCYAGVLRCILYRCALFNRVYWFPSIRRPRTKILPPSQPALPPRCDPPRTSSSPEPASARSILALAARFFFVCTWPSGT